MRPSVGPSHSCVVYSFGRGTLQASARTSKALSRFRPKALLLCSTRSPRLRALRNPLSPERSRWLLRKRPRGRDLVSGHEARGASWFSSWALPHSHFWNAARWAPVACRASSYVCFLCLYVSVLESSMTQPGPLSVRMAFMPSNWAPQFRVYRSATSYFFREPAGIIGH